MQKTHFTIGIAPFYTTSWTHCNRQWNREITLRQYRAYRKSFCYSIAVHHFNHSADSEEGKLIGHW